MTCTSKWHYGGSYLVLPDEDAAEFAAHEAALLPELAPVGPRQTILARRVAVAAWRLVRADPIEADLSAERSYGNDAGPGLALIREGNGTRSFEALLRYRGAVMAEFWRALRTLKALQAEQAAGAHVPDARPKSSRSPGLWCIPHRTGRTRPRPAPAALRDARPTGAGRTLHAPGPGWPKEPDGLLDAQRQRRGPPEN